MLPKGRGAKHTKLQ